MRILICDDEKAQRENAVESVQDILKKKKLLSEDAKGKDAVESCPPDELKVIVEEELFNYDIVVLDIEYHRDDMDGIILGKLINQHYPAVPIIYLTSQSSYAEDVYETEHCYFVLKQNWEKTLERALVKAVDLCTMNQKKGYIEIISDSRKNVVRQSDILYLERDGSAVKIVTKNNTFECYTTLSKVMKDLSTSFFRCHGSFIVNMKYVKSLEDKIIILDDDCRIPMGKTFVNKFRNAFLDYTAMNM